jgi:hypothetical protein
MKPGPVLRDRQVGQEEGDETTMLLLVLLALAALILFGAGFAIHLLWVIAVIAALLWVISFFLGGSRRRGAI